MVITYPRGQMPFDVDVGTIAQDYPDFLRPDKYSRDLIETTQQIKTLMGAGKTVPDALENRIKGFDPAGLFLVDHNIELRFPSVAMDFIQEIKKSKYADEALTNMSKASIRVVLSYAG